MENPIFLLNSIRTLRIQSNIQSIVDSIKKSINPSITLTLWFGAKDMYPGRDSSSRFCCCIVFPISATKCMLRCLRSNVLLEGIDRREAKTSAPKRGSRICSKAA